MTDKISLPHWLGVVDIANSGSGESRPSRPGSFAKGPFTIVKSGGEAEVISFGPTGSSALFFEGYLVDRRQLATDLSQPNEASDAQFAVAAYERWGIDLFCHLEGRYLIAIWDATGRRCLIGHDGLGKHPLYYAINGNHLQFASNIFSIAYGGAVSREPNRLALAWRLLLSWPPPGETFFDKIHRARPGHYLEIRGGAVTEKEYWQPSPEGQEAWLPEETVLEEFEPRLESCVRRYMELRPDGILLSGGVDSVTIAAIAQAHTRKEGLPPLTACCGQSPPGYPTTPGETLQNQVVQELAMPQLIWNDDRYLDGDLMLRDTIAQVPSLPAPTDVVGTCSYSSFWHEVAAKGVHTLLTGSGGDEWLSVHYAYVADLVRKGALLELLRFAKAESYSTSRKSVTAIFIALLRRHGMRRILASWGRQLAPSLKDAYSDRKAKTMLPDWLCPDPGLRASLLEDMASRRTPELTDSGALPQSYYLHNLRFLWRNPLMAHEFETEFHVSSSLGIKLVHPYHDRRLVDFLYRVPPRLLMQGNRYKGLLRTLAIGRLPRLGFENVRKISGQPAEERPAVQGLRSGLAAVWHELQHLHLHELGIVDADKLNPLFDNSQQLPFRTLYQLFNAVSAETWVAAHRS